MATTYTTPGVYVEEVASSSATLSAGATAVAAFVGFTAKAPPTDDPVNDPKGLKPRMVTSWTQYESLYGGFAPGIMLPHSVYGYFNNGGSIAYIVRIPHTTPAEKSGTLELLAADRTLGPAVEFTTVEPNAPISVDIKAEPKSDDPKAPPSFTVTVVEPGEPDEVHEGVTLLPGKSDLNTVFKDHPRVKVDTKIDTDKLAKDLASLQTGTFPIKPAEPTTSLPQATQFAGDGAKREGIEGLVIADDVTMVMVPDLITAATERDDKGNPVLDDAGKLKIDDTMWKTVQLALINHCEGQKNRMAILDPPPGKSVQQIREWRKEGMYDSQFAALYYPWISVNNPAAAEKDKDKTIMIPPSGHMAGIWARNDNERGVWKAPANEVVRGALKLELPITDAEQGTINMDGVNCIRGFGTRGIRVWGARTLSSNTDWQYINVRRLFNMVETAIMDGTQFAVFEPNDKALWEGLKRTVSSFLRGLWRDGALFGATAEQAFYVKCDEETNPPESIDQGKVIVEVGIAPVKPAEFVIFRIAQIKETSA